MKVGVNEPRSVLGIPRVTVGTECESESKWTSFGVGNSQSDSRNWVIGDITEVNDVLDIRLPRLLYHTNCSHQCTTSTQRVTANSGVVMNSVLAGKRRSGVLQNPLGSSGRPAEPQLGVVEGENQYEKRLLINCLKEAVIIATITWISIAHQLLFSVLFR